MSEYTKSKIKLNIASDLIQMRKEYREAGIPTILDESLNMLLLTAKIKNPKKKF